MKKHFAKESLFVLGALIGLIAIVILTSLADAGFDPSKLTKIGVFTTLIINAALTLFGVISTIPSGIAETKQRVNRDGTKGKYLQDFSEYNTIRKKIEPRRSAFTQWNERQCDKESYQKGIDFLKDRGVKQPIEILKLDREQIKTLLDPQRYVVEGNEVYFTSITPQQVGYCLKVYDGKVVVHKLPDYYFLYPTGRGTRTFYDQAYYESQDENLCLLARVAYKIFVGFAFTCVITGLTSSLHEHMTTAQTLQMIFTMVARIFNAVSSAFWGYLIGQEHVYKLCYYLNGRTQFLALFDADVDFKPLSLEEMAKLEYETKHKEKEDSKDGGTTFYDRCPIANGQLEEKGTGDILGKDAGLVSIGNWSSDNSICD